MSVTDYPALRRNMVKTQILPVDVTDQRIRRAMAAIPREAFVDHHNRPIAYAERWIETSPHRWMSPAGVMATLLQEVAIAVDDTVLVIAPGTGYSCAVIAQLAAAVVGLEDDPALAQDASAVLAELEIDNAIVENGQLALGLPEQGPYDVIWVDGVVEIIPDHWFEQLAPLGRLLAVVRLDDICIWRVHSKSENGNITVSNSGTRDQGSPVLPQLLRPARFAFHGQ